MDLLADNDATVKLAQCHLLQDLLNCFGNGSRLLVTETFRPWLRNRIKKQRVPAYVEAEIAATNPETIELEPECERLLGDFLLPDIQAGEAILFAASCGSRSSVLFTGDKRAVRALGSSPTLRKFYPALNGKILCVEQSILVLIESIGFADTRTKVVAALDSCPEIDTAVLSCFGSGMDAEPHNVLPCFQAYVTELQEHVGELMFSPESLA